ncbi:hypothetical protein SNOG_10737 [Parastagonospora nodorum SN15]|uniref:Uncharacterized protein n=1 Tax=Phaeosphaeria nodorum (strain SN15 / ATCC MYA-4574 / FGSC 10173) TaxID=321614 RepID=Q0UBX7_PHANO|nr:hypothetical protein SNOG_10737 [Parastagonospora nodorum SN15]EAT82131.1 hypothetical protein SNOG_10737 [Parastagonospora nodorum SN15]
MGLNMCCFGRKEYGAPDGRSCASFHHWGLEASENFNVHTGLFKRPLVQTWYFRVILWDRDFTRAQPYFTVGPFTPEPWMNDKSTAILIMSGVAVITAVLIYMEQSDMKNPKKRKIG